MYFPSIKLTKDGRNLISSSAYKNETLNFTRAVFGSGLYQNYASEDLLTLTGVLSPKVETKFSGVDLDSSSGVTTLTFNLNNELIETPFECKELGIYARLGTGEEKLYGYTCNGVNPETLQPYADGGYVITSFNILVIVGNAASVSAAISEVSGYATIAQLREHMNAENPHNIKLEDLNIKWNGVKIDYKIPNTLPDVTEKEDISSLLGKLARLIKNFRSHLTATNPHNIKYNDLMIDEGGNKVCLPVEYGGTGCASNKEFQETILKSINDAGGLKGIKIKIGDQEFDMENVIDITNALGVSTYDNISEGLQWNTGLYIGNQDGNIVIDPKTTYCSYLRFPVKYGEEYRMSGWMSQNRVAYAIYAEGEKLISWNTLPYLAYATGSRWHTFEFLVPKEAKEIIIMNYASLAGREVDDFILQKRIANV